MREGLSVPTLQQYRDFVMGRLAGLEGVRCRAMMGEYLLYDREKLVGGLYDNQLLVKPIAAAQALLPEADAVRPYEGASPLLRVERVEDGEFLCRLLEAMEPELSVMPRTRRVRSVQVGKRKER